MRNSPSTPSRSGVNGPNGDRSTKSGAMQLERDLLLPGSLVLLDEAPDDGGVGVGVRHGRPPVTRLEECIRRARRAVGSEHALHQHDVEPAPELAADLALGADRLEAARACSAIDASWSPTMRAITEWKPCAVAERTSSPSSATPMPLPRQSRCTYTESSTVGRVRGRGRYGLSDPKPTTSPSASVATIAGWPPACSSIHADLLLERCGARGRR